MTELQQETTLFVSFRPQVPILVKKYEAFSVHRCTLARGYLLYMKDDKAKDLDDNKDQVYDTVTSGEVFT